MSCAAREAWRKRRESVRWQGVLTGALMTSATTVRDPLIYEFETAEQEAAYNDWLRAEVEASRAEGGPYVENSVFLAEMKRHYNALAEAAGSR